MSIPLVRLLVFVCVYKLKTTHINSEAVSMRFLLLHLIYSIRKCLFQPTVSDLSTAVSFLYTFTSASIIFLTCPNNSHLLLIFHSSFFISLLTLPWPEQSFFSLSSPTYSPTPSSLLDLCLSPHSSPGISLRLFLTSRQLQCRIQGLLVWQCPSFNQEPTETDRDEQELDQWGAERVWTTPTWLCSVVWMLCAGCLADKLWARSALGCSIFNDVTHSGIVQQTEHSSHVWWLDWAQERHTDVSQGRSKEVVSER